MLPLLFVIIMPSHNFMVSFKTKGANCKLGVFFTVSNKYVNSLFWDCVGFYLFAPIGILLYIYTYISVGLVVEF